MYGIFDLCIGYSSYVWDICLIFWKQSKSHVSRVQLWRSILSSRRMQVLSKDAGLVEGCRSCRFGTNKKHMSPGCNYGEVYCLVVGCRSCQRMQVLSKDAGLVKACKACRRMQVLSKDARLVKGC